MGYFPNLVPPTSSLISSGYSPAKVPLCTNVTTLSQQQALQYNQQLQLFYKVYTFNSNAYVTYKNCNTAGPIYYTFRDAQERTQYNSALSLVNKLYPFIAMENASSINWQIPWGTQ